MLVKLKCGCMTDEAGQLKQIHCAEHKGVKAVPKPRKIRRLYEDIRPSENVAVVIWEGDVEVKTDEV